MLNVVSALYWVLPELNAQAGKQEPRPIVDGMLAYADGVNWNPGFGRGIFKRVSGAWVLLDAATTAATITLLGLIPLFPLFGRVTGSDFTTTSLTVVNITGLTLPLAASSTYEFQANVAVKSSTVAGIKVGLACSQAISAIEAQDEYGNYFTGVSSTLDRLTGLPFLSSAQLPGANYTGIQRFSGIIETSAACNLTVQLLKLTAGTATCFINSFIKAVKLP
jgi:hypothetical protein